MDNKITVGIHQPNYFPWMGFFFKIYASDFFVLHDNVEFTKKSFTKRVHIRKNQILHEKTYLSVPLKMHSDYTKIKDLEIDHREDWQKKHLDKIYNAYSRCSFFETYFKELRTFFEQQTKEIRFLSELNTAAIRLCCSWLEMNTNLILSSELPVSGKKTGYNINLVKHFNGQIYISGVGARKYQSEEFTIENIQLKYHNIYSFLESQPYPTIDGHFINGLSLIDAIMNIGAEGINDIFRNYLMILNK